MSFNNKRLQAVIEARSSSAKKASQESGIPPTTMRRMLSGKNPSVRTLDKICSWSGVSSAEFFTDGGECEKEERTA